jgi:zinc-ribbon domain
MHDIVKKLPPAAFVLALLCFVLPFVTFSCQGQKVITLNGLQLVTGTSIQQPQMFGPPQSQRVAPEPLAILAFLALIAGVPLSFLKGQKGAMASTVISGLAFIFLAAMASKLGSDATRQGGGAIQVSFEAGFYFTLLLILAALGAGVFAILQARGSPLVVSAGGGGSKFCAQCGARNEAGDLFCQECGAKFP